MEMKEKMRAAVSNPEQDNVMFRAFSKLLNLKHPEMTAEELKRRWFELKKDAGLMDG